MGLNLGQPHACILNKNYGYVNTMVLDNGVFFGLVLASLIPFMFGRFSQAQVGLKSKCPDMGLVLCCAEPFQKTTKSISGNQRRSGPLAFVGKWETKTPADPNPDHQPKPIRGKLAIGGCRL